MLKTTKYVRPVYDGKVTEFPQFALLCARSTLELASMWDELENSELPEEVKPKGENESQLNFFKERIFEFEKMTPQQIENACKADYEDQLRVYEEYKAKDDLAKQRIRNILREVKKWSPPTVDHEGFKFFMINELTTTLHGSGASKPPVKQSPQDWQESKLVELRRCADYYAAEHKKEIENARYCTEWIKSLRESLKNCE